MTDCLIVGRPNVGKTLFFVNFAEYLGIYNMEIEIEDPEAKSVRSVMTTEEARKTLVSEKPHTTVRLQRITLNLPCGKGTRTCRLVDTTGLNPSIHPDPLVRKAIAQTLKSLYKGGIVLHMVDLSTSVAGIGSLWDDLERQLSAFLSTRTVYAILGNKVDKPGANHGLRLLRKAVPGSQTVLPISALHKRGFKEVRGFVWRHLR